LDQVLTPEESKYHAMCRDIGISDFRLAPDCQRMFVSIEITCGSAFLKQRYRSMVSSLSLVSPEYVHSSPMRASSLAIAPHGRQLVARCDTKLVFLEALSLTKLQEVEFGRLDGMFDSMQYSPSGRYVLAVVGEDVHVVDASSMTLLCSSAMSVGMCMCWGIEFSRECLTYLRHNCPRSGFGPCSKYSVVCLDAQDLALMKENVLPLDDEDELLCGITLTVEKMAVSGRGVIFLYEPRSLQLLAQTELKHPTGSVVVSTIADMAFDSRSRYLAAEVGCIIFLFDATTLATLQVVRNCDSLRSPTPWMPLEQQQRQHAPVVMHIDHGEPPALRDESLLALHAGHQTADMIEDLISQRVQAKSARATHQGQSDSDPGVDDALLLIQFHRNPKELLDALRTHPALKRCRRAMWAAGQNFERPSGDMIFVQPHQLSAARRAEGHKTNNKFCVIVSEGFEYLLQAAIATISRGAWAKSRNIVEGSRSGSSSSCSMHVETGTDSEQQFGFDLVCSRTFLHFEPTPLNANSVVQSTTELHGGMNPRRKA